MQTSNTSTSPRSDSWNRRAAGLFPGASNGEYGIPPGDVPVLERGEGCRVWDTEGRDYLDMTMAWGAALTGHAHPKILEAAAAAARDGANFAAVTRRAVELAERIAELSPCADRIRLVASGTEATMLCLRVARTATGRGKVLKFEGAYHGQHPEGIASMITDGTRELPEVDSSGTGSFQIERDVLVAPYNDAATTETIVHRHADAIAAVIVEPLHRCLSPQPGFLESLRALTQRHGIALVFDEVVTGFRLARGGAQEYYGVQPDLVAYGKALGGGFPIGAYAGRADLMEVVEESRIGGERYAWSASTGGGNPVSSAAALAAIEIFSEPGFYPEMHRRGRYFRDRMAAVLSNAGIPARILGDGPLGQIAFTGSPVTNHREWLATDRARGRRLMLALLQRRVFLNPMGTKLYLSLAHGDAEIDEFAERLAAALAGIR